MRTLSAKPSKTANYLGGKYGSCVSAVKPDEEVEWAQRIVRAWRSIAGVGLIEFFFWRAFIRRMRIIIVPPLCAGELDNIPSKRRIANQESHYVVMP
jgi:hypothetical protein